MDKKLEEMFRYLHFLPSLLGYNYLKEAIKLKINKNYKLGEIYKMIATKNDVTPSSVERGIRTLYSHNKNYIKKIFGIDEAITNSKLIGLIIRQLKNNDNKIDPLEFEKIVKTLDENKYHICRSMMFNAEEGPYIAEWVIFRKDMSTEEYFSPKNLAILSSKNGNTLEDIKKLVEEF